MLTTLETTARGTAFTGRATLVDMLCYRAGVQPDEAAYTFLDDGERVGARWTWSDVDTRARAVAVWLREHLHTDDRALLMFPPGLDFIAGFFGCAYAGVIAVPVMPPLRGRAQRGVDRVRAIVDAARPATVLTSGKVVTLEGDLHLNANTAWLDCSSIDLSLADRWVAPQISPEALAFLQFTSGSTAAPRGVMVSHANLLHNLAYGFHVGESDADTVSVSWLPVTHDMGLIEGVLQPAFAGCPAYLMSPSAFLQRPLRWLNAISEFRGTRSGGPNFSYDLAASRMTEGHRTRLDLSCWKAAYNGAEPIRDETLNAFTAAFRSSGFRPSAFRPCYGLAEHTLLVSSDRWDQARVTDGVVSCGSPSCGTTVVIADRVTDHPCPEGQLGEICVASSSVAQGYWNDPDETRRTFIAMPGSDRRWLRTGDLGFIRDGRLYVSGRIKDLLIVRGAKHFPQDVERTAEDAHPAVRRGGVTAVAVSSGTRGDRVAVLAEIDGRRLTAADESNEVIASIRAAVADRHGLQLHAVALVGIGTLPKTTSGKPRRFLCREAWNHGTLQATALWSDAFDRNSAIAR